MGSFVAEEKDMFVCDFRWERLSVLKFLRKIGFVIPDPARTFSHGANVEQISRGGITDGTYASDCSWLYVIAPASHIGFDDVRGRSLVDQDLLCTCINDSSNVTI